MSNKNYQLKFIIPFLALFLMTPAFADTESSQPVEETTAIESAEPQVAAEPTTIDTLTSLIAQQLLIDKDIEELSAAFKKTTSDAEKAQINLDLDVKSKEAQDVARNIENLAANTDISVLRAVKEETFNFEREFFALLEPTLKEMNHLTSDVRAKADLRERIEFANKRIPIVQTALSNIAGLEENAANESLKKHLEKLKTRWQQKLDGYQTELNAATLQLEKYELDERLREENAPSYIKTFFQKRVWVLLKALGALTLVLLASRLLHRMLTFVIKGYQKENRSVRLRIIDLVHRTVTTVLMIVGPMLVFYLSEDWVLFTLSILLLIGIAFSLREAIPKYWHQIEIFLNIGSVREGERLLMDGIPWEVKNINLFTTLYNPRADLTKRVKLRELTGLNSRPCHKSEPWFPCERGDWVILSDGTRGKVIGISLELIELIQRGGARCTYTLSDFLSASPQNLSLNFRLKELLGISYSYQKLATTEAPAMLKAYLEKRLLADNYDKILLNLNVEFEKANDSSLDLVVIADFKGEAADLYNRLRRALQRYCVDASTEFNWEIPFPQVTYHRPA